MTTHDFIRDAEAAGALAAWRELGVLVDLTHASVTTAGLVARMEKLQEQASTKTGNSESFVFILPRQPNFDGAADPGDIVTFPSGGEVRYCVQRVEADPLEALWRLTAVRAEADTGTTPVAVSGAAFAPGGSGAPIQLGVPLSARIRETSEPMEFHGTGAPGPVALALIRRTAEAELTVANLGPLVSIGDKGTLSLSLKQAGGATTALNLAGMKVYSIERNIAQPPYSQTLRFRHEGTLDTSPVNVG